MKHEKEWYTCDRCGVEISDIGLYKILPERVGKVLTKSEYLEVISHSPYGYVSEKVHELPNAYNITIVRGYNQNKKSIHLCGKCRKEFERFMRNES